MLSALASAFTVPTPASQGSILICASPVYCKGECRSTSLKCKVRPDTYFSFGGYRRKTIDVVKGIFPRGNYPPHSQWNTDRQSGINEPRHYTDLKTIVKAPRILQEMSLMVLMVAAARPTPVIRLVLWFCHPND